MTCWLSALIAGVFVGVFIGVLVMSMMAMAKDD
jgi:F0F1-type ATP synthase assembly protein I